MSDNNQSIDGLIPHWEHKGTTGVVMHSGYIGTSKSIAIGHMASVILEDVDREYPQAKKSLVDAVKAIESIKPTFNGVKNKRPNKGLTIGSYSSKHRRK